MKRGERKNHDGFSSLIKLLMSSITSFETCLSTSQPPSPLSYIKPPANWFHSFVSAFVYTLPSFPSFVVSPFFSFSSLFPSPLLSSSLFYLYPFFFLFLHRDTFSKFIRNTPFVLLLHDSILQRFWYSVAMDTRSPICHERFAYNCETFEHRSAFYFDDPWRYREGGG